MHHHARADTERVLGFQKALRRIGAEARTQNKALQNHNDTACSNGCHCDPKISPELRAHVSAHFVEQRQEAAFDGEYRQPSQSEVCNQNRRSTIEEVFSQVRIAREVFQYRHVECSAIDPIHGLRERQDETHLRYQTSRGEQYEIVLEV